MGKAPYLIFGIDDDAPRQIAFALGNILKGFSYLDNRLADGPGKEYCRHAYYDKRQNTDKDNFVHHFVHHAQHCFFPDRHSVAPGSV
jgi:hypothetical protein